MKKLFISSGLLLANFLSGQAQSCCTKKAKCDGLVAFASDKTFKDAHLAPEPFDYQAESGKMITYSTPDGKKANAFQIKSGSKTNKVVYVFHEWWGLNDYIKREAEALQKELGNVDVYALDLYDGYAT
jgi:carboxymethylenebutenolidase